MDKMINCERLGVNEKWPKYKAVIVRFQKERQLAYDSDFTRIREYISREDANPSKLIVNDINITSYDASSLGRFKADEVLGLAVDNVNWISDLSHWTRYYQVGNGQEFFWHHRFRVIFPNHSNARRGFCMQTASHMMAVMALLGWKDAVIYQGCLTHAALNRNYQLELQYEEEHRRAQAFMLRLFADWVGDASHQWPGYAYDEPIYEALLKHWRTPDPQDLVHCLLAACDRHTHQIGKDTLKNFYDFQDLGLARTPIEILFLFRLREWIGLDNPILDHPLMAAPFNQLPPEQVMPELDELMQGVLKRAREDWPQYDEVLSLKGLKQSAAQSV